MLEQPRWFGKLAARYFIFAGIAFLWINFLYAPWPINWNLLFDFLFTRSGGPILYANHVSSELAIMLPATYFAIKYRSAKISLVVLGFVSIHEYVIQVNNWFFGISPITVWKYMLDLGLLLGLSILFANKNQRITLLEILGVCVAYQFFWFAMKIYFGLDVLTINGFLPGPAFFDWRENLLEIASWILPSTIWFLRKP